MNQLAQKTRQQNYYTQLMDFQESRRAPLIENNYCILPESYFKYLNIYTGPLYPPAKAFYPITAPKAYKEITTPLDVAAFNLTLYFDKENTKPGFAFFKKSMPPFLADFQNLTGTTLSFCPHKLPDSEERDTLLICYPGNVEKNDWSANYDHQENKTKAQFFAFLWDREFITEKQLFDSDVIQGSQAHNILNFKKQLEETGQFNPSASSTSSRPAML